MVKFVAEFTTNHMGNFHVLLEMLKKAKEIGCDYVKMQKKNVETFYTKEKLQAPYESPYGKNFLDYRKTFEFIKDEFVEFDKQCKQTGMKWFSTVQDIQSLLFMLDFDLPMYKVASCNARNKEFLKELSILVSRNKTIVISVGGSTMKQIMETVELFPEHNLYLLHCVSEYPVIPKHLRLGNIEQLLQINDNRIKIGFSSHEEGILASLCAIDMGIELLERHFCLSRHSFVHHIECALEPDEYKKLITISRASPILSGYYSDLPKEAFENNFTMSELEKKFLVEHKYGIDYLKERTKFNDTK